jgi:hypothetical protein
VWAAYLEKKTATAPVDSTRAPEPVDPNAALRAQAAAITAQAQARGNGVTASASDQRVVKSINDTSIIIFDPKLGADVTLTDNLMRATWTITPKVPAGMSVEAKPQNFEAFFEGADQEAGAGKKTVKFLKGAGTAIADSGNTRANATSSITAKTDVWDVKEHEGKITKNVFESGGMRTGGYVASTGRDPGGSQGESILVAIRKDIELAKQAILDAQQKGQSTGFDLTTDRVQRGLDSLQAATKDYN